MNFKICNHISRVVFKKKILNKYDVDYFQCSNCRFIQTEKPYWLDESYNSAITDLDIGLVSRNIKFSLIIKDLLESSMFNSKGKYLDYAGGYGLFVRLMRDNGFDYYRQDMYCNNIFANYFDIENLEKNTKFEIITAFEFFEHVENPLQELENLFLLSDTLIFSTELQPENINNWWYFMPEIGQHISFYNIESLEEIAKTLNINLYSNNKDLHILTKKKLKKNPFNLNFKQRFKNKILYLINNSNKNSLLNRDFEFIKNMKE